MGMCERPCETDEHLRVVRPFPCKNTAALAGRTCGRRGAQCSPPFGKEGGPGGPADML